MTSTLQDISNPFVGLRPFESGESLLFFGRQEQTTQLLQRLHRHHFVAVTGSSGSGKSSLIRAGLIPRLKAGYLVEDRDNWMVVMMKPGENPLYNLAVALLDQLVSDISVDFLVEKMREEGANALMDLLKHLLEKNTNILLLVDQFEEIFRFSREQKEEKKELDQKDVERSDEAIDFVNIMLELTQQPIVPVYVVMTMRSDYLGDCARFFGLPEALNQCQYLVPRLNRVQMRQTIEGPIKLFGAKIDPALTSRLLNDITNINDELPLLQHVLMRIWDHGHKKNSKSELDLDDYIKVGSIEKALSKHADEALVEMSDEELVITKKIFQALTAIDEKERIIRRPVHLSELELLTNVNRNHLMEIIKRFTKDGYSFLVESKGIEDGDILIDISHESLIRQWYKLNAWVEEEAKLAKHYRWLSDDAERWQNENESKDFLLNGTKLLRALKLLDEGFSSVWRQRYNKNLKKNLHYLWESRKAWKEELRKEEEEKLKEEQRKEKARLDKIEEEAWWAEEQRKEKARQEKRRSDFILIVVIFSVLAAYISLLLVNYFKAKNANKAFRWIAVAKHKVNTDPTIALRIAEAAIQKNSEFWILNEAQQIYWQNTFYKTIIKDRITACAYSLDGQKILTGSDNTARLWSKDGTLEKEFKGHKSSIYSVAFSPDGKMILTGSLDDTARLWSVYGALLKKYGHTGFIWSVNFSPDGKKILTGSSDSTAKLWNIEGSLINEFKGHKDAVRSVAFSPDGQLILTGSLDNTARLWSLNGTLLKEFQGHKGSILSVAFSPDSNKILTGSLDNTAKLWSMNGSLLKEFKGHTRPIRSVSFSPDGQKILTGSYDNTGRLWSIEGSLLKEFKGHNDGINSASFSPDGQNVLTSSYDETVRIWSLGSILLSKFKVSPSSVLSVALSPDGQLMLTGSDDSVARLWNKNGDLQKEFKGHTGSVFSVAFSPDGRSIVTGSDDNTTRIWSIEGNLLKRIEYRADVYSVAFSPDGQNILTGYLDGMVKLWGLDSTIKKEFLINELKGQAGSIFSVAFSPDGQKILAGSKDYIARLWSINGDTIKRFIGHNGSILSVAFSPDGKKILTGSYDNTVRIWNVRDTLLLYESKIGADTITSMAFSKDGSKFLTGSSKGDVALWDLKYIPLEDFLRSGLIDSLTFQQKKEYGIK